MRAALVGAEPMSRGTYNALGVLQTPRGKVIVRRAHVKKQGTYILVFDGPHDALRLVLPSWKPRSTKSRRTQLTPTTPLKTKTAIAAWYQALLPELLHRIAHPAESVQAGTYTTFEQAITVVETAMKRSLRPTTLATYQQQWRTLLRYLPGDTEMIRIDRDLLQGVVNQLAEDGYAPATVHNIVNVLGRVVVRAIEDGVLSQNPLEKVALPKVVEKPPRYLDRQQRARLLEVAEGAGRDAHLLVACGVYLGLRKAELLALKWEHVDLAKRLVVVQNTDDFTTKSAKTRVVPIGDAMLAIFQRYQRRRSRSYVIAPHKRPGRRYRWDFRKTLARLARAAGVPWLTVHGLRHTYATLLAQGGVSLFKVRCWLGHASVATTEVYAHASAEWDPDVNKAS